MLAKQENVSEFSASFDALSQAFEQVLATFEKHLNSNVQQSESASIGTDDLILELDKTAAALKDGAYISPDELGYCDLHQSDDQLKQQLNQLKESVLQFDSEQALAVIEKLKAQLN